MIAAGLAKLRTKAVATGKPVKSTIGRKSDPSTLAIVFMAFVCAILPLDISQLGFAILGAVLYAILQKPEKKHDKLGPQKQAAPLAVTTVAQRIPMQSANSKANPKVLPKRVTGSCDGLPMRSVTPPIPKPEARSASVQPIVAPTFQSTSWLGEIQELLLQITPTDEVEKIVKSLAGTMEETVVKIIPEMKVDGFASANFTSGRAFGVAVPDVDIVATVSPRILFERLHGHKTAASSAQIDAKKLHKCAIRACTDRLVSMGGFKFRRSAFRGHEPKVTLLAPTSLGLFTEAIPIDFSINIVTPLYNAALLTECGKIDVRSKELILIVKRWAKDRGICHAAKGHLPPYAWGLLTIYYLQVGVSGEDPVLPPLEQFAISAGLLTKPIMRRGQNEGVKMQERTKLQSQSGEPRKCVGELFKEFLHFFDTQFDWCNEAVSVSAGRRAPPSLDLPLHVITSEDSTTQPGLNIEDPFCEAQNLADGMTATSYSRLKEEILRANQLCQRGASLSELLEPWAPPNVEVADPDGDDENASVMHSKKLPCKSPLQSVAKGEAQSQTTTPPTPPWRR